MAGFLSMRDLGRVNAKELDAELGLVFRDSDEGISVADALDLGEEGAGGSRRGRS
jgi:hypothetical protein